MEKKRNCIFPKIIFHSGLQEIIPEKNKITYQQQTLACFLAKI